MDRIKNDTQDKDELSENSLPQNSIRGPVDTYKPTSASNINVSSTLSPTIPFDNTRIRPLSPVSDISIRSASSSVSQPSKPQSRNTFSALLKPSLYQSLTVLEIPPPFRNHASLPDLSTSLSDLITAGHFRDAAIKAAQLLSTTRQTLSPEQIFDLFYKRLACLTLCNQTTLAAREVKALEDLNSAHYRDEKTGKHLAPWELRVLAVRLQGIGFGDVRRGVIGFYDLACETRIILSNLKKTRKLKRNLDENTAEIDSEITLWEHRLSDLGLRVASALIEMEDFEGAVRFLSTLQLSPFNTNLNYQKAMLWLCLGDVKSALTCAPEEKVITTLAYIADGDFERAVEGWKHLIETGDETQKVMWKQNLAVSLIYLGRIDEARKILEELTFEKGYGFHALTFNLSTIFELCTERSSPLKIGLAERLAEILESSKEQNLEGIKVGWDKVNGDFKL